MLRTWLRCKAEDIRRPQMSCPITILYHHSVLSAPSLALLCRRCLPDDRTWLTVILVSRKDDLGVGVFDVVVFVFNGF